MAELPEAKSKSSILIIDDDRTQLKTLADLFQLEELQPICCQSGADALKICQEQTVNVAVLDLCLPDMNGVKLLRALKAQNPEIKIIINTAYATVESAIDAVNEEAFAYVRKMDNVEELLGHVHRAFHTHFATYSQRLEDEVKKRTEALRKSEERFRNLVEGSIEGILVQRNTKPLFVNQAYARILGYESPAEILAMDSVVPLIAPYEQERVLSYYAACIKKKPTPNQYEYGAVCKDGSIVTLQQVVSVIPWADEPAVLSTIIDVTEHKQAEQTLWESESKYRLLFKNANIGIILFDTIGTYQLLNEHIATMLGGKPDDFIGKSLHEVFPEQADFHLQRFAKIIQEKKGNTFEDPFPLPDGTRWYSSNLQPIIDHTGSVSGIQIVSVDITERKRARKALQKSEERIRTLVENVRVGIFRSTPDFSAHQGQILTANPTFLMMFRLDEKTLDKVHMADLYANPNERKVFIDNLTVQGSVTGVEVRLRRKDNTLFLGSITASVAYNESGEVTYFDGVIEDITERKRAEEALIESNLRFLQLAKNIEDIFWLVEVTSLDDYMILYVNPAFERIWQRTAEEIYENPAVWYDCIHAEDKDRILTVFMSFLQGQGDFDQEFRIIRPDNSMRIVVVKGYLIRAENDKIIRAAGVCRDITEQVQTEEALRESEALYRNLIETTLAVAWEVDIASQCFTYISPQIRDISGFTPEQWIDFYFWAEQIHPDDREDAVNFCNAEAAKGLDHAFDYRMLTADGRSIWIRDMVSVIKDQGQPVALRGYFIDITERKQAEESLRLLNQAIEQSPASVMITDTKGVIQYVNPKFTQITGYSAEESVGQTPDILRSGHHPPAFYQELWDTIATGDEWQGEFYNKTKHGNLYWEHASIVGVKDQSGKITHYVSVKEDITKRKQAEEEYVRQQRLVAVGQLAAGIAHDFNNMLTSVIGYAELLQLDPSLTISVHSDLARIVKHSQRAAKLVRQILDFSRQTVNELRPLNLDIYLSETLKFIERTIPETIQIQFNVTPGDYTIKADTAQLQQVITNLAVNARDAMPEGGILYLNLSCLSLSLEKTHPCADMATGEWIKLTVRDTGSGIAPEVLPHIFEPFFTTKEVGQGTGLGLAQIYGIVQQHDGCITANSQVEQGATFTLYFPAVTAQTTTKNETIEAIPRGMGEIVLLVEDNQAVREVTQAMLESLNYQVLTAKDGEEGLALYRTQADQIALILTDAVMPGMGGFALASTLQIEAPELKVILMSGYADNSKIPTETIQNITIRLEKPLGVSQLAEAMQEALGSTL